MPGSWQPILNHRLMSRHSSLRALRLEHGLTQVELAQRARVSRQLVAAVEAGLNTPAVDSALRLADALGTTAEALFTATPPTASEGELRKPTALRLGRGGSRWVPAGLVIAGCDPAIGVAETMLQGEGPRRLLSVSAPTGIAVSALAARTVHGAVVHGPPGELPEPPVPVTRIQLAHWQVGLALSDDQGRPSLDALLSGAIPLAQRDPAAASQQALERAASRAGLQTLPDGPRAGGHLEAAWMAATLGAAGVSTEAAATALGLSFVALEEHTVEIWIARTWATHPEAIALQDLLGHPAFTKRVARFRGYDLSGCGENRT